MLKLYTDQTYFTLENRKKVFPLLFYLTYKINLKLSSYYCLVDTIEECDVAVIPIDVGVLIKNKKKQWLNDFIDRAILNEKIVWTYSAGDFGLTLYKNVYNFRLGGFDSKLDSNTIILPSFISDPYEILKKDFSVITKTEKPKIGFVGNANNSFFKYIKEFLVFLKRNGLRKWYGNYFDYQVFYPSSIKRHRILKRLKMTDTIEANFIFRNAYRAGVKNEVDRIRTTEEFFKNIEQNQYTFCLRGVGNFSVRFYETLFVGRIPVVVNTDIRLPFSEHIEWSKHCVIVSEENLCSQLLGWHKKISDEEFMDLQLANRKLYQEFLQADSFFIHIHNVFFEKYNL